MNSQTVAPATAGVVSCSQLAWAACAVTRTPPATIANVAPIRVILPPRACLDTTIISVSDLYAGNGLCQKYYLDCRLLLGVSLSQASQQRRSMS